MPTIGEYLLLTQPSVHAKLAAIASLAAKADPALRREASVYEQFIQMLTYDKRFVRAVLAGAQGAIFAAAGSVAKSVGYKPRRLASAVRQAAAVVVERNQRREKRVC